jgi:hypothetical protein
MKVHETPDYLEMSDGSYITTIVVGVPEHDTPGYPRTIMPSLIGGLLNTSQQRLSIGYSFKITPVSQAESNRAFEAAEFQNIDDELREKEMRGRARNKTAFVASDIRSDQQRVHDQDVQLSDTSCIITIRTDSPEELGIARSHINSIINNNLVGSVSPTMRHFEAYKCGQPWGRMDKKYTVDALSPQVASLLPVRSQSVHLSKTGIWFGTHKITKQEILVDLDALAAPHGIILGPSGSGKTTAEIVLGMRYHDMSDYRVVYLTVKSDAGTQFRNAPAHYGDAGNVIDVGYGEGKSVINPLQIIFDKSMVDETKPDYLGIYHRHKAIVFSFFDAFLKEGLSAPQQNYLDDALNRLYHNSGIITESNWSIECHPGKWGDGANFPTLHLLRKLFWDDMTSKKMGILQPSVESLYNNSTSLDVKGAFAYLNSQTTADFSKDFIVFDLSGLDGRLQDAMSVLVTGIIGLRFRTDAKKRTLVIIDEGVAFVRNRTRMDFVSDASMMGRSLRVAFMICFTQAADLTPELAAMLKANSMWSLIFGRGMDKASAKLAQDFFMIDDAYLKYATNQPVGDGVLMLGNQTIPIHFDVTKQEMGVLKGVNPGADKVPTDGAFMVSSSVSDLVLENSFCLDEWINDPVPTQMRELGFVPIRVQRAIGQGVAKAWILDEIVTGDPNSTDAKVMNQSLSHYVSVIQLAGYLMQSGFEDVEVHHHDLEDIGFRLGDEQFVIEYEMPRSHTAKELLEKKMKHETNGKRCFFVGQSSYAKFLSGAVDKSCVYPRGTQIKAALDAVLLEHNGNQNGGLEDEQ